MDDLCDLNVLISSSQFRFCPDLSTNKENKPIIPIELWSFIFKTVTIIQRGKYQHKG